MSEWKMVRLGDIFDLQMGKTPDRNKPEYFNTNTNKWVSIADISKAQKYISETKECISDEAVKNSGIKQIPANTIIMSFKLSIGKTAITTEPMYSNEAIMAFLPNRKYEVDNNFFYYLFSNKNWSEGSNKAVKGVTLNKATLTEVKIPIPPLDEQKQIAAVLDKCTAIIAKRQQQLSALNDLIKARFVEMFGDRNKYPQEPLEKNVKEMFIGPFGSALKNECFVKKEESFCMVYEQKHAIQKTMNVPTRYVDEKKYQELKRFSVFPGDVLVSCRGTIGEIFVVPDCAPLGIMHPSIMKIRLNKDVYDQRFFVFALGQYMSENNDKANGSGVKMAVTATTLGKELFVVPPIKVQKRFSDFSAQIEKSKITIKQSLTKTQMLFDSLMQEYFG